MNEAIKGQVFVQPLAAFSLTHETFKGPSFHVVRDCAKMTATFILFSHKNRVTKGKCAFTVIVGKLTGVIQCALGPLTTRTSC